MGKLYRYSLTLLLTIAGLTSVSRLAVALKTENSAAPFFEECDFYPEKARALGCSADNYLMRFGDHYCLEFENAKAQFSQAGIQVLNCIRPCLIKTLQRTDLTCDNVQPIAFASHVECYTQCGFCEMPLTDKMKIATMVWHEMFRPEFRSAMDEIGKRCLALAPAPQ